MSKVTQDDLCQALKKIGIEYGDNIFLRANLWRIGPCEGNVAQTLVSALQTIIGQQATILTPTFTPASTIFNYKKIDPFTIQTQSSSGLFANEFLAIPGVIRSSHPVNSYAALGASAKSLLADHHVKAFPYLPQKKMLEMKNPGKALIIGCLAESPGVATHVAQGAVGLTTKNWLKYFIRVPYLENNSVKLYRPIHLGGCSKGFKKFYSDYLVEDAMRIGKVGRALSAVIDIKRSYDIEKKLLTDNPRYGLCDNIGCAWCHLCVYYNKRDYIAYLSHKIASVCKNVLCKKQH